MGKKNHNTSEELVPADWPEEVAEAELVVEPPVFLEIPEVTPAEIVELTHPADIVPLKVYAALAGYKWDQLAGFVNYARRKNLGPMTVAAWHAAYQIFQDKPVS